MRCGDYRYDGLNPAKIEQGYEWMNPTAMTA